MAEAPEDVYELTFGEFVFRVAPDPCGPKWLRVAVFQAGQPFVDLHDKPFVRAFSRTGQRRIEAFCRKFAEDERFRNGTLVKTAFSCC